jgi:hypothetical protein
LKITQGSAGGNLDGGGKLPLTDDRKSIAGLTLQIVNKAAKKASSACFGERVGAFYCLIQADVP